MQLAATQRPHPPPVPPRPSRQVVAEALKRSPRPPCPTRQAPPPPNTKPWRSDQEQQPNQQQVCPAGGRTIVYESTKESAKESINETNDNSLQNIDKAQQDRRQDQATSERNEDNEDYRENTRERRHRNNEQEHCENLTAQVGTKERSHPQENVSDSQIRESPTEKSCPKRAENRGNSLEAKDHHVLLEAKSLLVQRSRNERLNDETVKDVKDPWEETSMEIKKEAIVPIPKERLTDPVMKPTVATRSNVSFDDECCSSISLEARTGRLKTSHEKSTHFDKDEVKLDGRPTPTQRSCLVKHQEASAASGNVTRKSTEVLSDEISSPHEIAKSTGNVDRATVVVIDQPERKAALDDNEENNENDHYHDEVFDDDENDIDNNIHRQDWLEAGVRYSSTQITLSGDDGDVVDGNRVNGFDHRENEKVTDLNFIRYIDPQKVEKPID